MSDYTVAFLIKTLQNGMSESQETAGRCVLETALIPSELLVNIDGKMITGLVKREKEVHSEIKKVAGYKKTLKGAIKYVEENILPLISDLVIADVCLAILKEIEEDPTAADSIVGDLRALFVQKDYASFLATAILYALTRGNNVKSQEVKTDDFLYMEEAAYRCPLCGAELYSIVRGKHVYRYRVVHMFPADLDPDMHTAFCAVHDAPKKVDSADNKIALCSDCGSDYVIAPDPDEYRRALTAKERIVRMAQAKSAATASKIEKEIADIIHAVAGIDRSTKLKPFTEALTLDKKIKPEFFLLQDSIQQRVIRYYSFVETQFSIIDGAPNGRHFNIIRSEVTACYEQLEARGLDQEEICEKLADWLLSKNNLGTTHKTAAAIIVAFFVQNCGVFHEIAQ